MKNQLFTKASILRGLLSFFFLMVGVSGAWAEDETLTITGASSGHNATWGTSYGDGSGSSTTSASNSIGITYKQVARMSSSIQIAKNTANGFYSTSVPEGKVIKSISIVSKTNSVNVQVSTDGKSWSDNDYISSSTTRNYTSADGYKYFKVSATSNYAQITSILVTYQDTDNRTALETPSNLRTSSTSKTGAVLEWDAVSNASSYLVKVGEIEYPTTNTSYTLVDLIPYSDYEWTVKAIADNSNATYMDGRFSKPQAFFTASGKLSVIDFEKATDTYSDWTFSNISLASSISAYKGEKYGTNNSSTTASITTKEKILAPQYLKCYVSKSSNNTTASFWKIEVSSDGETWEEVNSCPASSMSQGTWVGFGAELSSYEDVYVRISYGSSGAARAIDQLTLVYSDDYKSTMPIISPADGTEFSTQTREVTITAASGARIYYTLDESTPDETKLEYKAPFNISGTTTIKAIAYEDGKRPSSIATSTITYVAPVTDYDIICKAPVGGTYTVKVGNSEAISITSNSTISGGEGKTITLTTTPAVGYRLGSTPFVVIAEDETSVSIRKSGENYTFTMPSQAVTITAKYSAVYSITASSDIEHGSISFTDKDDNAITETSQGSKVNVVVNPEDGYELTSLYYIKDGEETQNDIYENRYFSMVGNNVTVYATFSKIHYTITYASDLTGGIISGPETACVGDVVELNAMPNEGFALAAWDVKQNVVPIEVTDNKFVMPASDRVTVSATFRQIANILLSENGVEIPLSGSYYIGDEITLPSGTSTTVPDGKTFMGWSEQVIETTDSKPDYLASGSKYTVTEALTTFYAVYASENNNTSDIVFNVGTVAKDRNWSNAVAYTNVTKDPLTFKVSGGGNNGKYYESDNTWRFYSGGSLSISTPTNVSIKSVTSKPNAEFVKQNNGSYLCSFSGTVKFSEITVEVSSPTISAYTTFCVVSPIFDTSAGAYTEYKTVKVSNYNRNFKYAYTIDGTDPSFDFDKNISNGVVYDHNEGISIASTCTLKVVAIDTEGNVSAITSAEYVIHVYSSLESLAAEDLTSGTVVTVSFENVPIKSFYTNTSNVRTGVYFAIQKENSDIEIYYYGAPDSWVVGGTLSGTMTCPWKKYSGTWELAPNANTWDWSNLTYVAPKTLTSLSVSGSPNKTTYEVGDAFDPAGLVVTANYSDKSSETIFEDIEWIFDYGTGNDAFVAGATSVDVVACVGNVMSEVYSVEGLTVKNPVSLISIFVSGTPNKTSYYAGDVFDPTGLVVTGTYSDESEETITEGIEWIIDPETLTLGITSVDVIAVVDDVMSDAYTVNGLTVKENPYKTATISTFVETSGDINDDISYEAFQGDASTTPAINNNNLRLYQNGGYVTVAAKTGLKIAKVKITTSSTYASTTVGYCADDEDAPTTGETVAKSSSYTINNLNNRSVSIYCLGTDKNTRLEIAKIEVTYNGTLVVELESIALSGNYPTEFAQGDDFSHDGMVVTATMTDKTTKDVSASAVFSGYDMTKVGEQTVTVSYTEDEITKTASYLLTVREAPFVPTPAQDGYEIYSFNDKNFADRYRFDKIKCESFMMEFAKGSNQNGNVPTYYTSDKTARAYVGNTITITAAEDIMAVVVDYVSDYVDEAQTIRGLGTTSAVITFSTTCRFTSITVYYRVYTRAMSLAEGQTKWGTICLPDSVVLAATITGAEFYSILGVTKEGEEVSGIVLGKVETGLVAGMPYLFKATGDLFCAYIGDAVSEPVSATGLVGSFAGCDVHDGCYVLSNNQIRKVNGGTAKIGPNRAYIDLNGVGEYTDSNANALRFGFDGEVEDYTTYIQAIQYDAEVEIFDLLGNKVQTMKKGQLYIVNGKKMFNK